MSKQIKRLLAIVCALALACTMLAGCSAKTTESSSAASAASTEASSAEASSAESTAKGGMTLKGIIATSWDTKALEACVSKYEEESGNKVELEVIPDDQLTDLITVRLSTGSDVPDLFFGNPVFTADQISQWFVPLDDCSWVANLNADHVKNAYQRNGKLYCAPYGGASCLGFMYNKDILKAAGVTVPDDIDTYEELLASCQKIKDAGYTPISISNAESWTAQILGLGCEWAILSDDEKTQLTKGTMTYADMPEMVELVSNIKAFQDKGFINDDFMSTTMDMSIEDVATGTCAMTPAGDWSYNPMLENFPDADSKVGMMPIADYKDTCYVNVGTSSKYVWATNMNSADQQAAALDFINWFMGEDAVKAYYELEPGICPQSNIEVNMNSWDSEMLGYAKTYPLTPVEPILSGFSSGDFAGSMQKMFGGYSVQEMLDNWYNDCKQTNVAAGTAGF